MSKIEVRPVRPEDIIALGYELPGVRARAWTGVIDGEPVAIGGYWFTPSGDPVAFLNADPEICRAAPVALMKAAKALLSDVMARGFVSIRAFCNVNIEGADRFLERLGFQLINEQTNEYLMTLNGGRKWRH